MRVKALLKFLALVGALLVVLFLFAQLIHAVDERSHQTHSPTEQLRARPAASAVSSSVPTRQTSFASSTGTPVAITRGNNALFVAAPPAPHAHLSSSTGSIAPQSAPASTEPVATPFTTLAVEDDQLPSGDSARVNDDLAAHSLKAASGRDEQEEDAVEGETGADAEQAADNERLTYTTFTHASAPSRPLCRALAGKVSSHFEYGAEGSASENDQQQADQHDWRVTLSLDHVEARVDRVELHVKIAPDEHQQPHVNFDSADERHGLSRAELTYGMVAQQYGLRRGEQQWEKLITFLAHAGSSRTQVAFTLHQRALACTTPYRTLQLPTALVEGEQQQREKHVSGWEGSKEDVRQASHDIVALLGSLASLVSSAAVVLTPESATPFIAPSNRLSDSSPQSTAIVAAASTSPCSNLSFTATTRLVNTTRVHVLYTPHYHHPAIRSIQLLLRNVSRPAPLFSFRPYRMYRVRHTHMPVYRAVVQMGPSTTGEVHFDYLFRVTLKRGHVTCTVPGGHFSSIASPSSAPPAPSQSISWPHTVAERCPVTDVFNVSAKIIRSSRVQASSTSSQHAYKLVLTSHALQLDWVHVHLFVNASEPKATTEGRYRMTRAITAAGNMQQPASDGVRWERVLGSAVDAQAAVEYAFTFHFNGTSCDTKARVSTIERLLMDQESVQPSEQIKSLFQVLDADEDEQSKEEQEDVVEELMEAAQQEDGLHKVEVEAQPDARSEHQAAAVDWMGEQMDAFAAGTTTASLAIAQQPPQALGVSIDALGRVVPASVPFDVTQHAGIGPVAPPPYHQYHQPPLTMHSTTHTAPATASAPVFSAQAVYSTPTQQAAAMGGGHTLLDAGGCAGGDYVCQVTELCRPCMDRSHPDLCTPCAHLFNCPTEECAHAAVHLLTHTWHCLHCAAGATDSPVRSLAHGSCVVQTCRLCHIARSVPGPPPQVCHDLC